MMATGFEVTVTAKKFAPKLNLKIGAVVLVLLAFLLFSKTAC